MKRNRMLLLSLALAALALPTFAGNVGNPVPRPELEGFTQTQAKSYDDLMGRAVLIEFFAYWCKYCPDSVPHMNEFQEQFGAKGLTVVGVTAETKELTEPWMEKYGAKYAYAYDKGNKFASQLSLPGLPHAILVDPTGKIVWDGHPNELKAADIEKALAGALTKPMWEWPASAKDVRAALQKHKYADALAGAAKLSETDGGPAIKNAIQQIVASRVAAMKAALAAGNFLEASDLAGDLQADLAGLPELPEAKSVADAVKANKDAGPVIKAQKAIRELKDEKLGKAKEMEKAIADMKKIIKDLPGTFAETEAKAFLQQLEAKKRKK